MEIQQLNIKGAWLARSSVFTDNRGSFREWFKKSELNEITGQTFDVRQSNVSISNKGALRGLHYSLAAEGQSKWITCVSGSIWDVVVDIRPSSPTFKKWIGINLENGLGEALFLTDGLAHGFLALEDNSVVSYLLTSMYAPEKEFGINPMDPDLAIKWPIKAKYLSSKDLNAPDISHLIEQKLLPGLFEE
jgi:dTDP-4-dehydrorhamnose 3,5-epimerase